MEQQLDVLARFLLAQLRGIGDRCVKCPERRWVSSWVLVLGGGAFFLERYAPADVRTTFPCGAAVTVFPACAVVGRAVPSCYHSVRACTGEPLAAHGHPFPIANATLGGDSSERKPRVHIGLPERIRSILSRQAHLEDGAAAP